METTVLRYQYLRNRKVGEVVAATKHSLAPKSSSFVFIYFFFVFLFKVNENAQLC